MSLVDSQKDWLKQFLLIYNVISMYGLDEVMRHTFLIIHSTRDFYFSHHATRNISSSLILCKKVKYR